MLKKLVLAAFAAALVVFTVPSLVNAYGACHVGYTHVGPSGVYHSGATVASGPGGTYASRSTGYSSYGGGGAAYGAHYSSTGTSSGQLYAPTHASGYSSASSYNYSNIR